MVAKLYYDDSKDLYEGLITEEDNGVKTQIAMVLPAGREHGRKLAAALDMYEVLKQVQPYVSYTGHPGLLKLINEALAKAEGKEA